uniref:hypothetical protein n=1 Tax=Paractinoplanes polyasparticus TaxID=2856853 RepID=UPI001C84C4CB|nr:hypothetical protein [Actinoplanes polyasparticus]
MDQIPRDIELAVRAAAEAPKGYAGELPAVYRRARRHRIRRRTTAVAGALTVLAGLVGGGLAVRQNADATPPFNPAVAVTTSPQRLLLSGADGQYVAAQGDPSPARLTGDLRIGELSVDDHLLTHAVEGGGDYDRSIGLPDGRLVSLGPRGTAVGGDSGLEMLLTIQAPGRGTQQRNVRQEGQPVSLAAADATTAYLWRPYGLYAHDLSGGLERLVISSAMLDLPDDNPAGALDAADVTGDRLLIAASSRSCRPLLMSIAPPQGLRFLPLTSLGCRRVTGLRLSPSTGRVAVSYQKSGGAVRVAVLSTENGAVLADREVVAAGGKGTQTVDLAWTDERIVRGVAVPVGGTGPHELRQFTIPT